MTEKSNYKERIEKLFNEGSFEKALAIAREGIEKFPESGEMWNDYGVLQNQLGNPLGAAKSLEKALSLDNALPETHKNLEDLQQEFSSLTTDEIIERPIFICGSGRSGTTLLAMILDSHPNMVSGPEIKGVQFITTLYGIFSEKIHKNLAEYNFHDSDMKVSFRRFISSLFTKRNISGRVVEQTPLNINSMSELIAIFPDAQFLHIIRDGRDVVSSLIKRKWIDGMTGKPFEATESIERAAIFWNNIMKNAKDVSHRALNKSNYLEFKYEDLINSQEETIRYVLDFLGEPFDNTILDYHKHEHSFGPSTDKPQTGIYKTALGRWKNEFSPEDAQLFDLIAGQMLIELGYEENNDWVNFTIPKNKNNNS